MYSYRYLFSRLSRRLWWLRHHDQREKGDLGEAWPPQTPPPDKWCILEQYILAPAVSRRVAKRRMGRPPTKERLMPFDRRCMFHKLGVESSDQLRRRFISHRIRS